MPVLVVDSFAWIAYFEKNPAYKEAIEENVLKTPSIVLAEVSRVLRKKGIAKELARELIEFIKSKSIVIQLTAENAVKGGELAEEEKLPLVDAIIYAHASEKEPLLTGDGHFHGKKNVFFIKL